MNESEDVFKHPVNTKDQVTLLWFITGNWQPDLLETSEINWILLFI